MRLLAPAWGSVAITGIAAVGYTAHLASNARAAASAAQIELSRATAEATELLLLRAAAASPAAKRSSSGLAQRVSASLSRAGLPATYLSSLSPESQSVQVEGDARLKRQRATLVLTSLTLPQLGSFLDAWRRSESEWTVTSVDVSPAAGMTNTSTGGDLPLRSVLSLESVSTEEPPASYPFVRTSTEGAR